MKELNLKDLKEWFDIKCKKCKSDNVTLLDHEGAITFSCNNATCDNDKITYPE
ncbi:hypothetical protein [Bacillus sp. AFS040349]|uniref:hypothetical protein n=1 Tax=Bacillus sp. AFS040349 TaxID=2033502 RepID=UPI00159BB642|nr:hypothetical protein [Bacillus sp. AFS040349]